MKTTIAISHYIKKELLQTAAKLQLTQGKRVNLDEAIHFLLYDKKRPELLEQACKPLKNASKAQKLLLRERAKDEERAHRKYGV